ncbi:hypothetical protein NW761_003373 [Fusarium oxysporum]|nr:hypothetical protein NW763_008516 [Fusarium oxysporum]KAJ4057020.1 hypothetical protein NW758_001447 [Fusarium oxysporum]KAJ4069475.1 hypothetical protein NW753_000355 [Fusarium oxysporum]KAJ4100389.1 hypothetical protein NW761_003373 [Fusarium oxysporum]KAJ4101389.1 hypothetical protein NW756_001801 [Fusarium oxysporum]
MLSSNVLPGNTIEATSTATVIESTADLTSTIVESARETETADIPTTTTAIVEESTTTDAASTTTSAAVDNTSCSTSDDCVANTELCLVNGLNLCVCLDAVCVTVD